MRLALLAIFTVITCLQTGFAQTGIADLQAQSPDGKTVKLAWITTSMPPGFNGFDIKRKDGLGDWKQLNSVPLLPGISLKKDLTPYESDNTDATRIKEKLKDLIAAGKLREYDFNTFIGRWATNDKEIQDVMGLAMLDFDISIISGFGFVDHTVSQKMEYQYGLFLHQNGELVDKISWNYGTVPDLDVVREISSKALPGRPGVELSWSVEVGRMKSSLIAGFNVYKRGIRLNDHPIWIDGKKDLSNFSWNDAGANSSVAEQYSISAESIFGIEGLITSYNYVPSEHPTGYSKTVVSSIASRGYYYRDGIQVSWTFPKDQERFISGFYVEKDNMPDGYRRVSELLPADQRSFIDNTGSPVSTPFRMRIVAAYKDRTMFAGIERMFNYFPLIDPPKPQNVQAVVKTERQNVAVKVSWDRPMNGDSTTDRFSVWCVRNALDKATQIAGNLTPSQNTCGYDVPQGVSATIGFFVRASSRFSGESFSDTVYVITPSTFLPAPTAHASRSGDSSVAVHWDFTDVSDLAGFRLYSNGTLIADEKQLVRGIRDYTFTGLAPATTYNFTVRAVSEKLIVSDASAPAVVDMPVPQKP
ncbi:MAG: fibronectin type III domain-containing protein [Taibaiella sp.]|nr:fibronectin type III domain-containing protein [Taibaiella sp.]